MLERPKILIVTSEFPPEPGGIGNHAYNLAKSLTANNYTVEIVTDQRLLEASIEQKFDLSNKFNIKRINITSPRFLMYLTRLYFIFMRIKNNDIVIASGKFSLWSVAILSFLFNKKTMIAVLHGSEVNLANKSLKAFTDFSIKKFDTVIAVSTFTKTLIKHLKLKNISVIPNGFTLTNQLLDKKKNIEHFPKLITVGNVTKRKGQINVIESLPYLIKKYPKLIYHIVGKPTEKEHFLKKAIDLNVQNYIVFHGIVSEEKKHELLKSSDIFVMLSENLENGDVEGFGIALLEANSVGLPTIGSKNCGIEDAIDNYNSGILVTHNNEQELEQAISDILKKYDLYSKKAKQWSTNFTWEKVVKQYIQILKN